MTTTTCITTPEHLADVVSAIRANVRGVGLDIETTGLSHHRDQVRSLQIATQSSTFIIRFSSLPDPATSLKALFNALAEREVVGHDLNSKLPFLMRLGFDPGRLFDVQLASQVLHAGDDDIEHSLDVLTDRYLGRTSSETCNPSKTPGMRGCDAERPLKIKQYLDRAAQSADLTDVIEIENRALPCVAWMAQHGIAFDRDEWQSLTAEIADEVSRLVGELDELSPNTRTLTGSTNWNSLEEVRIAFARVGTTLNAINDDVLATVDHLLAVKLREYRAANALSGTNSRKWREHVAADGRVYATWNQLGASLTGRMSCTNPNLQGIPRDKRYRRCFVAPPGRVLIKADYSQIELRIAARITGDARLRNAYCKGADLHTLTASTIMNKPHNNITGDDRQTAKAVNFGLLYGQGDAGLVAYALSSFGVRLSDSDAKRYREKFFSSFPDIRKWHRSVGDRPCDTRTLVGRRRLNVEQYTERLNTPVQGTGADGMKQALALLWARRAECPGAFPVLVVHDEIVVECSESQADTASTWLKSAMVDGMAPLLDPVPIVVEVVVGNSLASD